MPEARSADIFRDLADWLEFFCFIIQKSHISSKDLLGLFMSLLNNDRLRLKERGKKKKEGKIALTLQTQARPEPVALQ